MHFGEDYVGEIVCDGDVAFVAKGGVGVGVGGVASGPGVGGLVVVSAAMDGVDYVNLPLREAVFFVVRMEPFRQ